MSDFRCILRGTFISGQYHFGYTGPVSLHFTAASGQSLLFRKEVLINTFSGIPLGMWLLLCSFFSSTSITLRVGWVKVWSGSAVAGLFVEQLEVQKFTTPALLASQLKTKVESCGQGDNGTAQPSPSLREAETGHCHPRILSHSHSLKSSICILTLALRAYSSFSVSGPPGRGKVNHPFMPPKFISLDLHLFTLMAHPWSTLAWASLTVIF